MITFTFGSTICDHILFQLWPYISSQRVYHGMFQFCNNYHNVNSLVAINSFMTRLNFRKTHNNRKRIQNV